MTRSCFLATRDLYQQTFAPQNEQSRPTEIKLGLTSGQIRWQRLSWLYFLYHLNNNSKTREQRLPELDLASKFYKK